MTVSVAGLTKEGTTFKVASTSLSEASEKVSQCLIVWIQLVLEDISLSAEEVAQELDLAIPPSVLFEGYLSNYEDKGDVLGLMFPTLAVRRQDVDVSPVLIYVTRNRVVTIHDEYSAKLLKLASYAETFLRKLPGGPVESMDRQTVLLARILDELVEHNFTALRVITERTQFLEMELMAASSASRAFGAEVAQLKKSVMTFLNAAWAAHDTVHSLRYGDADMISDDKDLLAKFDLVLAGLDRQISMAGHLLEVMSAGATALQTEVANRLTTLALWLTVLGTAVLVPNTLATVYGIPYLPLSPERHAWWILWSIVLSTLGSGGIAYWYVKRLWRKRRSRKLE